MEIRFLASIRVSDQFGDLGASCSKNTCKKQGDVTVITTYTMAASYPILARARQMPEMVQTVCLGPGAACHTILRDGFMRSISSLPQG